jgi:hypothetical protein
MNPSLPSTPFISAHLRSRVVIILLITGVVVNGLSILCSGLELQFPMPTEGQELGDAPVGFALGFFIIAMALISVVVYLSTVVAFCMWLHRAYKNLSAFGAFRLNHSPGWAVGSFFVPFVNLVVPYRAVKEVWQKSIPPEQSRLSEPSPPGWFPFWWLFWLLCTWAGNISFRMSFNEGVSESTTAIVSIVADFLAIVAALFAYVVIGEIDDRQEETARLLGLKNVASPPPPPTLHEPVVSVVNNPSSP